MNHLRKISRMMVAPASLKGGVVVKDCTPVKENAGKCEDT